MSQYPTTSATFTTKQDGQGQYVFASHLNAVQAEITALTTALLTTGLAHHLTPDVDSARDLGTASKAFRNLYVDTVNYTTLNPAPSSFSGLYTDLDFTGGNVHSIPTLAIVNADIDAAAAIAYSKLALTGGIVNADVNASAAIAYSKLALSNSIVNTDVNTSAAIAYSKLALSNSIVNADVNSSAAIAWSKISKTSSSLADLATRSAEDLSSGILPDARLNTYTNRSYSSGNYTGSGSMTWNVESGDALVDRYVRIGPLVFYNFYVYGSSVTGTPDTALKIALPVNGYETYTIYWYSDNGTAGVGSMRSNGTSLELSKTDGSNWSASTNNTAVRGMMIYFAI